MGPISLGGSYRSCGLNVLIFGFLVLHQVTSRFLVVIRRNVLHIADDPRNVLSPRSPVAFAIAPPVDGSFRLYKLDDLPL